MKNCANCIYIKKEDDVLIECNNYEHKDVMKYYIEVLAFDFELFNSGICAEKCPGYEELK